MGEFKLTVKHPEFSDDTEFDIDGVGVVKNGESIAVTQQMQDTYAANNDGADLKKGLAQNGIHVQFSGKDKLVDGTDETTDVPEDVAAAKAARDAASRGGEQ